MTNATQVAAGGFHTCALLSSGAADCWGYNAQGQLGDGTAGNPSDTPVGVMSITDATQVAGGGNHTSALVSTGHVDCWGSNGSGQLGNGSTTNSGTPVTTAGISTATQVAAGGADSCARLSTAHVECWGSNTEGQLGDGTTTGPEKCSAEACSTGPVAVSGITDAPEVAGGGAHTCALLSTGHIECWGKNTYGELGDGTTTGSSTPIEVTGI